jgi:aspartate aminotransferase/aminotransferase
MSERVAEYRAKRDYMLSQLRPNYEIHGAQGAFYLFPRTPWGTGVEFTTEAIGQGLLIIPGNVFSGRDTHFRISYAAEDSVLERGCETLRKLLR